MLNSTALDVVIGLVLVYVIFSLFSTAINEWVARLLALRATGLRQGVNELLDDVTQSGLAAEFHRHPLVDVLKPAQVPVLRRFIGSGSADALYPSYMDATTFALAVMDLTMDVSTHPLVGTPVQATLNQTVKGAPNKKVPDVIRAALIDVGTNADAVRSRLEQWFNAGMNRVSGWYKRRIQVILVVIATLVAVMLDVDSIRIAHVLYTDPALRSALVAQAQQIAGKDSAAVRKMLRSQMDSLERTGFPIGWDSSCYPMVSIVRRVRGSRPAPGGTQCVASTESAVGLLLTIIALSLGAPFWFDALNRIVNLRQTGTPPDSSARGAS